MGGHGFDSRYQRQDVSGDEEDPVNVFVEDAENSVDAGTSGRDDPLHLPVKPEAMVNIE